MYFNCSYQYSIFIFKSVIGELQQWSIICDELLSGRHNCYQDAIIVIRTPYAGRTTFSCHMDTLYYYDRVVPHNICVHLFWCRLIAGITVCTKQWCANKLIIDKITMGGRCSLNERGILQSGSYICQVLHLHSWDMPCHSNNNHK